MEVTASSHFLRSQFKGKYQRNDNMVCGSGKEKSKGDTSLTYSLESKIHFLLYR